MKKILLLLLLCALNVSFAMAAITVTTSGTTCTITTDAGGEINGHTFVDVDKAATTVVINGTVSNEDLTALNQFIAATTINLDGATLASGASISNITSSSVKYLALPQSIASISASDMTNCKTKL